MKGYCDYSPCPSAKMEYFPKGNVMSNLALFAENVSHMMRRFVLRQTRRSRRPPPSERVTEIGPILESILPMHKR
jgi:hypothetical protein